VREGGREGYDLLSNCYTIATLTAPSLLPSLPPFLPPSLPNSSTESGGVKEEEGGREGGREGGVLALPALLRFGEGDRRNAAGAVVFEKETDILPKVGR